MIERAQARSRRTVVQTAIAGVIAGACWSTGFVWATDARNPTIDVLGRDQSQLVLLDTGRERILILVGPFDSELIEHMGSLMGLMRQRIDILVATESALASGAATMRQRWNIATTIALPEAGKPASPRARVASTDPMVISLAASMTMRLWPHHRFGQSQPGDDAGWRIEIARGDQVACVARNIDDLAAVPCGPFAVVIAPTGSAALMDRKPFAQAYAINAESIEASPPESITVRIFDSDIARFDIETDEIRLPNWTSVPGRAS